MTRRHTMILFLFDALDLVSRTRNWLYRLEELQHPTDSRTLGNAEVSSFVALSELLRRPIEASRDTLRVDQHSCAVYPHLNAMP